MNSNTDDEIEEFRDRAVKSMEQFLEYIKGANVDCIVVRQRIKNVDSIKEKQHKLDVPLGKIADLIGVRIIVEDEKKCFTEAAKILKACEHNDNLKFMAGKNYITNPRQTGYKGYHLYYLLNNMMSAEIQIMTKEMEKFADSTHSEFRKMKYGKNDSNEDFTR